VRPAVWRGRAGLPSFFLRLLLPKFAPAVTKAAMKFLHLFLLAALGWAAFARADLTVVQNVEGDANAAHVTLRVKGDKARVEISPEVTMILDAGTGELITLMNNQKTVMRISGERAKAMAEMAGAESKDSGIEAPPQPTGQKKVINGYDTDEYVSDSPKYHTIYWVAKNYPNYQNILSQLSVLHKSVFAAMHKNMPDYNKLPGLPIRTEIKSQGKMDIISTLVSVNTDPLPDSDFAIPAGYSELKMPDFLGRKKEPAKPSPSGGE
jgi:hypothetical protein